MTRSRDPAAVEQMLASDETLREEWEASRADRSVARALLAARRSAGLSQKELAQAAGWDPAFVCRLESGRGNVPSFETLARYTAICGARAMLVVSEVSGEPIAEIDLRLRPRRGASGKL